MGLAGKKHLNKETERGSGETLILISFSDSFFCFSASLRFRLSSSRRFLFSSSLWRFFSSSRRLLSSLFSSRILCIKNSIYFKKQKYKSVLNIQVLQRNSEQLFPNLLFQLLVLNIFQKWCCPFS